MTTRDLLLSYPLLALAVGCPRCGAAPDQRCTDSAGLCADRARAYSDLLDRHRTTLAEQLRCPSCHTWGTWTNGRSTAAGDPVDEYWCPCGAATPLARCERRPTVVISRTTAQRDADQRAQQVAATAVEDLLATTAPGTPLTFTHAHTALRRAGVEAAPEWILGHLDALAAAGRLDAAGPGQWRTRA